MRERIAEPQGAALLPRHEVSVRFFQLAEPLQPYFTALYSTAVECEAGVRLTDFLHPEWAALRFTEGPVALACVGPGEMFPHWPFIANGPTSKSIRFALARCRMWGLGLQPAGWAKFVDAPADELADVTVDGSSHPAFARFAPLLGQVLGAGGDAEEVPRRVNEYLVRIADRPVPNEQQILACQQALRDPEISGVAQLGERIGMTPRSLGRLCRRYFGFSPKLLLRRQRFLRSLAQFMLEPSSTWIGAMDGQYHDQAQFVREFRAFMGLSPRQYAALPHPILKPIMQQRMADQGAVPPRLDLPTIMRYQPDESPNRASGD